MTRGVGLTRLEISEYEPGTLHVRLQQVQRVPTADTKRGLVFEDQYDLLWVTIYNQLVPVEIANHPMYIGFTSDLHSNMKISAKKAGTLK